MASKTLYVYVDMSLNPKVRVDPIVWGKALLKWRRDPDSPCDFDFVGIVFNTPDPFSIEKLEDDKINVKNDLTPGNYEYTIVVKCGDEYVHTTELGPPAPGDKPVIRN